MRPEIQHALRWPIQSLDAVWQIATETRTLRVALIAAASLAFLAAWIPQMPAEIAREPAAAARWTATQMAGSERIGLAASALGLSQIYSGLAWRTLGAVLFVLLAVRLVASRQAGATTILIRARQATLAGGLLVLMGLWISGQAAWQEKGVLLQTGRIVPLVHQPGLSLQIASIQPLRVRMARAGGQEAIVAPASPWQGAWRGIRVVSRGFVPSVTVRATPTLTATAGSVLLQPLGSEQRMSELTLEFAASQVENGFAAPEQGIVFRLVSFERAPGGPAGQPALLVQTFESGESEPGFSEFITQDTTITVRGVEYHFKIDQAARVDAIYDPGAPIVLAGASIAWIGIVVWLMGGILARRRGRSGHRTEVLGTTAAEPAIARRGDWRNAWRAASASAAPWLAALALGILTGSLWWGVWREGNYWLETSVQRWLLAATLGLWSWQIGALEAGDEEVLSWTREEG